MRTVRAAPVVLVVLAAAVPGARGAYCPVLAETYAVNTANVNSAMQLIRVADGAVTDIDDQPGMDALDLCGDTRVRTTVQAPPEHVQQARPAERGLRCGRALLRQSSLLTDADGERVDVEITRLKDTEPDDTGYKYAVQGQAQNIDKRPFDSSYNNPGVVNGIRAGMSVACAGPTRSTRASARPTDTAPSATPTAFAKICATCRRCGFRLCAATTPTTTARRRVGRGAGVAITLDEVWLFSDDLDGTSNLMENIILTGPDYILAHEDRTYNGASATNYCECQSEGTRSAEEDLYVTKGYGPQLPTDACLDCTFVGADAAAQLATLRQQPGFPAEMEAAIAAGHVYFGNAGVRSGSISK